MPNNSKTTNLVRIAAALYDTKPSQAFCSAWLVAPTTVCEAARELLSDLLKVEGMELDHGWSTATTRIAMSALQAVLCEELGVEPDFSEAVDALRCLFEEEE